MSLQCAARSMADRVMSSILAGASATNSVRDRRPRAPRCGDVADHSASPLPSGCEERPSGPQPL